MRLFGVVKWFNDAKGFGFISQENGPDVFVSYTEIHCDGFRSLGEGERVYFELSDGPKGKQATNVRKEKDEDIEGFGEILKRETNLGFQLALRDFLKNVKSSHKEIDLAAHLLKFLPGRELCPVCHTVNPTKNKYCGQCGKELPPPITIIGC